MFLYTLILILIFLNFILIFIPQSSSRAEYVFSILLKILLGLNFELTHDKNYFNNFVGQKFSYTKNKLNNELFFTSTDLLFENEINSEQFSKLTINTAFTIDHPLFNIDIFAASFFLLTRYEEYGHRNFAHQKSILFRSHLLQQPVVNQWAVQLETILQQNFPELKFQKRNYQFIPTIDVDRAFAFKARNAFKTIGGFAKDFLKRNFFEMKKRFAVLFQNVKDPFDVFDELENVHEQNNLRAKYFFHCGNYNGVDKNIDLQNANFKTLINRLQTTADIGLHPSVKSNNNFDLLENERNVLENLLQKKVNDSRQHFIQLHFPNTYQCLIELDIKNDFTMGYVTTVGFRAGICNSFYWYDLENETTTDLIVHPFCWIETVFQEFQTVTDEEMWRQTKQIINAVKHVDGEFCGVWHNHSLSELYEFKGWKNKYEQFVKLAK